MSESYLLSNDICKTPLRAIVFSREVITFPSWNTGRGVCYYHQVMIAVPVSRWIMLGLGQNNGNAI